MSNLVSNLILGADTSNLQKGLSDAAVASRKAGNEIKAASEQIATSSDKQEVATKSLVQAQRAASKEAQILVQNNGQLSASALEATVHAGKLKDELNDYRTIEKTLGSKVPAMTSMGNAAKVAAGGIESAAGAMALFGAKSEDTELMLQRVMGAMAFANGIKELAEMKDVLVGINAVIAANPMAAVILAFVALGAIAYTIYKSIEDDAEEAANKQIEEQKRVNAIIGQGISAAASNYARTKKLEADLNEDGLAKLKIEKEAELKTFQDTYRKELYEAQGNVLATNLILETGRKELALITQKYAEAETEYVAKQKVKEIERKKSFDSNFSDWSTAEQHSLLTAELASYKKGTDAYKDKANEIKILDKEMSNSHKQAQEINFSITKTLGTSDAIGSHLGELSKPKQYKLPITFKAIGNPIEPMLKQTKVELTQLQKELASDISSSTSGMASAIGEAMVNGGDVAKAAGDSLMKSLGQIAIQKGEFYIAMGAAEAVALDPMSIAHLAGGAALVLAGSAIGAMAGGGKSSSASSSGGSSSSSSTGWSGAGSGSYGSNSGGAMALTTRLDGRNMQIMLGRNNYRTGRIQ